MKSEGFLIINPKADKIFISNNDGERKNVIMFPVTRTEASSRKKWKEVLDLMYLDENLIIVIIDKTPESKIARYCQSSYGNFMGRLYVMPRPLDESVFDSQKYVTLDKNLWITQIHDDDDWAGSPTIPRDAQDHEVFTFNIGKVSNSTFDEQILYGQLKTQEIIFGAIPSKIWNSFTAYLEAQGPSAADSLDSSLYLLCDFFGSIKRRDGFSYSWNADNWTDRAFAIENLQKSTLKMGWEKYSGVNASLCHRALDQISSLSFCARQLNFTLQKSDLENVIAKFQLRSSFSLNYSSKPSRTRVALSATRDNTNIIKRIIKVMYYIIFTPQKIEQYDTLNLYLVGIKPILDDHGFNQEFISLLEEWSDPILKQKCIIWAKELHEINLLLQK